MEMSGCCADESMYYQVDDKHQISQLTFEDINIEFERVFGNVLEIQPAEDYKKKLHFHELDLPPPEADKRIKFCSLIYYG